VQIRTPSTRGGLARSVLLGLLPLTLGPLIVLAILLFRQVEADLSAQVNAQLDALAEIKQTQIEQWVAARLDNLTNLAASPDVLQAARTLRLSREPAAQAALRERLDRFVADNVDYKSLMLVDADTGEVLAASAAAAAMLGGSLKDEAFFEAARFAALFQPPRYDPRMNPEALSLAAAAPVIDAQAGTQALLVAVLLETRLLQIITPAPGLGATGEVYAVSQDGYRLGSVITPQIAKPDSLGIRRALNEQQDGFDQYPNPAGVLVIGRYRWLPGPELALLVEQVEAEAYAPLDRTRVTLALTTALAAGAALIAGLLFTRRLVAPIQALTTSAARIAAGDLEARVAVDRSDEIGALARAFNQMTADLRTSVRSLQLTAEARTRQLAATGDLSRTAAARLGLESLLARVTDLIAERFGFDQVSIFLLDEAGTTALLQEANGAVGVQLKAQGYRLPVEPTSLVGWATANNAARIAPDVAADPLYRPEALLPATRSEAVVPLRLGERVIGALDLQSQQPAAFAPDDVEFLQALADQIAVAVENSRLLARQQRLLQLEALVISLTNRIHQSYKPETILESAATELGRALGASRAVVRLFPPPAALETPDQPAAPRKP
jgi:HAMP domain-containing protein